VCGTTAPCQRLDDCLAGDQQPSAGGVSQHAADGVHQFALKINISRAKSPAVHWLGAAHLFRPLERILRASDPMRLGGTLAGAP
jgi:hypothetical protein